MVGQYYEETCQIMKALIMVLYLPSIKKFDKFRPATRLKQREAKRQIRAQARASVTFFHYTLNGVYHTICCHDLCMDAFGCGLFNKTNVS